MTLCNIIDKFNLFNVQNIDNRVISTNSGMSESTNGDVICVSENSRMKERFEIVSI